MSLRLQAEKKKAHDKMHRLMAERKKKDLKPTKIDNPLAKYNAGKLMCILCSSIVRSENVWQVHVNSKQHRGNVEQAKKLKELTNNFTAVNKNKRISPHKDVPPNKKLKSILKNTGEQTAGLVRKPKTSDSNFVSFHNEEIKRAPLKPITLDTEGTSENPSTSTEKEQDETPVVDDQPIPEGFFDDPILDAKVRNIEYKDPVEEEWEKFQKEIKNEATASAEIIAGEQEEATAERQIDEIDEQIRNWSRVLDLELKKEENKNKKHEVEQMDEDENNDSDNDADIDEFLDWRAKKSYS